MKANTSNQQSDTIRIPELDIIDLDHTDLDGKSIHAPKETTTQPFKEDISRGSQYKAEELLFEESEEEEEFQDAPSHKSRLHLLIHLGFFLLLILIVALAVHRIRNFGTKIDLDQYEGNADVEILDHMMPLIPTDDTQIIDDGKDTIVLFGNAPFAADRDSENGLAAMIEAKTDATVYNCAVEDSYLAAQLPTLTADYNHIDAFTFYWLTTAFCLDNTTDDAYEWLFSTWGSDAPPDAKLAYDLAKSIDYSTVDTIVLMYDGTDYLLGHNMYSDQNDTDIQTFTGNMCAGIDLIQQTYPHIRIIVMSPTYAFALNENGEYVSSDQYRYNNQDVLSTYVIKQRDFCYDRGVTFVDNLYGTITEDNAAQYLTDHIHLNEEGREMVADRLVYALNYFNKNK